MNPDIHTQIAEHRLTGQPTERMLLLREILEWGVASLREEDELLSHNRYGDYITRILIRTKNDSGIQFYYPEIHWALTNAQHIGEEWDTNTRNHVLERVHIDTDCYAPMPYI